MFFVTTAFFFTALSPRAEATVASYGPVTLVNPMVGTANGGNTFPGAVVPWGMVSVSPHNDLQSPSGYISGRPYLYGFGHTHLSGAETPALGNVTLMPTTGPVKPEAEDRKSEYDSEGAFPGYYKARLKTYGLLAEMTAACHSGLSRYTFGAQNGDANILVDAGETLATDSQRQRAQVESSVRILSPQEVEGVCANNPWGKDSGEGSKVYFVARFSKDAEKTGTWKDGQLSEGQEQKGKDVGAFFRFSTAEGEPIEVKVGISYVSLENARLNLQTEIPDWDFEGLMRQDLSLWDAQLSKVRLTGGEPTAQKIFYTALYHCLLQPCVFSDVNGQYQGFAHSGVKTAKDYTRYSFFSLTAASRTLHPLLTLVYPQVELDMVKSLVEMGREGGILPRSEWAGQESGQGVGIPAVVVLADTYLKGLMTFDIPSALAQVEKTMGPDSASELYGGLKYFLKLGFVPQDPEGESPVWGAASAGLEYSQSFFALSQWAKALGQDDLSKAALSKIGAYHKLYDPETHFLTPRNLDGAFIKNFDPKATCCDQPWPGSGGPGFYEGTAWQYLFDAPQDLEGLKLLLGGPLGFSKRLEDFLTQEGYDPGNFADLNAPYLFDAVPGQEWKTQKYARKFLAQNYGPNADGLPGHDQAGALSAWYVFSAMGFYPVCPGSLLYQLGSPLFQKVEIDIDKSFYAGDNLVIKTLNNSPRNLYVQSVDFNGIPTKSFLLTHDQLTRGGVLALKMGSSPAP